MKKQSWLIASLVLMFSALIIGLLWSIQSGHRGAHRAQRGHRSPSKPIDLIDKQCRSRVGSDGFGVAVLAGQIRLVKQAGRLSVNCRLQLQPGASLTIIDSRLETQQLLISDNSAATGPSHVDVQNSILVGIGLEVRLKAAGSSVDVQDSQLKFGLSVGLSVGSEADQLASLTVKKSVLRSDDQASEGVVLVSTGHGWFVGNQFQLRPGDLALLLSEDCHSAQNTGQSTACKGT